MNVGEEGRSKSFQLDWDEGAETRAAHYEGAYNVCHDPAPTQLSSPLISAIPSYSPHPPLGTFSGRPLWLRMCYALLCI